MDALHAEASEQLGRLFPNMETHVPNETEDDPSSDVDDDFDTVEGLAAREVEYQRTAAAATAAGVPPRRSSRTSLVASTAAADAARRAERAPLRADPQVPPGV